LCVAYALLPQKINLRIFFFTYVPHACIKCLKQHKLQSSLNFLQPLKEYKMGYDHELLILHFNITVN
ncbi:MAG: hypothetical protein MUP85_08750, partial [Candidatus Lokiarchaeota archaeon]|nr:hypothetical protein [Candidatus Lokiarchaeota archaeon]